MKKSHNIDRRTFLQQGTHLALAGSAMVNVNAHEALAQRDSSVKPFVTCRKDKTLVGVYSNPDEVIHHPEYLDRLQNQLGCNTIIIGGGVKYPDHILQYAPFPLEKEQWIGVPYAENDENIHRCAEILHDRDMDIWLMECGHYDSGNDDALAPVDFDGNLLRNQNVPPYAIEASTALCFQKQRIIDWQVNAYSWICSEFDIDALYVTHHRYNTPSLYYRLRGCACEDCQSAALRLGYNFSRMKQGMVQLEHHLSSLTKHRVNEIARLGFTFSDFIQTVEGGIEALNWLEFRAAAVTDSLRHINNGIKKSTGGKCHFISDTVGPTFSLFVGHDLKHFVGDVSDAYYAMAWTDYHYMSVIASWAYALVQNVDGLDEHTALNAVYSLVGWDDIDLPRNRIADLHIGKSGKEHKSAEFVSRFRDYIPRLMIHEYRRGAMVNARNYPSYQTVFPYFWGREITEPLIEEILSCGHDGYIFEISPEPFVERPK